MYNNTYPYQFYGFNPTPSSPQPVGQSQLIKVSGLEGAKAYQLPPNSAVALFHESEDILYIKTTDGAGFPTIRQFRFEPIKEDTVQFTQYVTLDEFNKFKEEVLNGKQSVRKTPTADEG